MACWGVKRYMAETAICEGWPVMLWWCIGPPIWCMGESSTPSRMPPECLSERLDMPRAAKPVEGPTMEAPALPWKCIGEARRAVSVMSMAEDMERAVKPPSPERLERMVKLPSWPTFGPRKEAASMPMDAAPGGADVPGPWWMLSGWGRAPCMLGSADSPARNPGLTMFRGDCELSTMLRAPELAGPTTMVAAGLSARQLDREARLSTADCASLSGL